MKKIEVKITSISGGVKTTVTEYYDKIESEEFDRFLEKVGSGDDFYNFSTFSISEIKAVKVTYPDGTIIEKEVL